MQTSSASGTGGQSVRDRDGGGEAPAKAFTLVRWATQGVLGRALPWPDVCVRAAVWRHRPQLRAQSR